ncbi:hypothetical protein [Daejeonella oryzae]|uniref:hypothetical protein n=1 Tax=Daejeonella oryzae TaxID=1122943 RepID=UPI0004089A60|nr:hypothetical protein [Daejeonella oryzae]
MSYSFVKRINRQEEFQYKFSVCTLVSNFPEYQEMLDSYIRKGFDSESCEYLCIDNSQNNVYDAFAGLNRFLREAKGKYIILCHQDILLHDHDRRYLESRIEELNILDQNWAILANAGGINLKYLAMHLTQKSGNRLLENILPLKAQTVDENFMVIRNDANLALSSDLKGFHMYGTDICLMADALGFNAYIIDFNLTHKSDGNADQSFDKLRIALMRKYRKAFRGRFMSTTITRMYISGNRIAFHFFNLRPVMFLIRQYYKFLTSKAEYKPKKKNK